MHKLLIVIGFCLVTFLGVISCYDEHNTFGDRLVDSDLRNIRMDTSSIITTAVLIDSLEPPENKLSWRADTCIRYGGRSQLPVIFLICVRNIRRKQM